MDKAKAVELAVPIFTANPKAKKLFVTADEQVFFTENHAFNNAKELNKKDPVVIPVDRIDLSAPDGAEKKEKKSNKKEKDSADPVITAPE